MLLQPEYAAFMEKKGDCQLEFDDEVNECRSLDDQPVSRGFEQEAVEFEVNGENLFESLIALCRQGISSQRPITFQ